MTRVCFGSRCETLKIGVIRHCQSFMVAERSATIREEANVKTIGMVLEEKLYRTALGSSSIDEEDAEVELENEPVRWTEKDVEIDGALQKWTLGEFDQSELSICGTWRNVVYMDDEKWFFVEEERNMAKTRFSGCKSSRKLARRTCTETLAMMG